MGKIDNAPPKAVKQLKAHYQTNMVMSDILDEFKRASGISVSASTVKNYMKEHGVTRGFMHSIDQADVAKDTHAKKKAAKTRAERQARERLTMLVEDGVLKVSEVVNHAYTPAEVDKLWQKHVVGGKKKKKAKKK